MLYRYKSNKKTNMIVEGHDIKEENGTQSVEQYIDFIFLIRNQFFEIENNTTKKNWFSGYIGILNITINNGTDDINIFYDKNLTNYLNEIDGIKNNKNNDNLNLRLIDEKNTVNDSLINNEEKENSSSCFVKIEFYENGEIKQIYLPEIFSSISNMVFIGNIIKLIIPKLSTNLYIENITDKINELNKNEFEIEDNSDNIYINEEEKKEEENEKDFENSKRILQDKEEETDEDEIDKFEEKEKEEDDDIEDYTIPKSDTDLDEINIDLRECKNINDSLNNYTNITEYSYQPLENDDVSLKDSELNTVIYSNINENGVLYAIKEIQTAILNQQEKKDEEEIKKAEEKLKKKYIIQIMKYL